MPKYPKGITQRRDTGRLQARIQVDGKRVRLGEWPDTDAGLAAASEALKQARREVEDGKWAPPSTVTLGEWLQTWNKRREQDVALGVIRRTTVASDTTALNRLPTTLLNRPMRTIRNDDIRNLAVDLLDSGLSRQTVKNTIKPLRKVCRAAVTEGFIDKDPTEGVRIEVPRPDRDFDDQQSWTAEQVRNLLPQLHDFDNQLVTVAVLTGMRRSELAGLRWRNVDLDEGLIRVRDTAVMIDNRPEFRAGVVKSKSSRRTIVLPPAAVAVLKQRKGQQAVERLAAGELWIDGDFVFARPDGTVLDPSWVTKRIAKIAERNGLPHIGAHGLRHTFATISLENGVSIVTVAEALGHADVGVTADTYSHVTEKIARDAAVVVTDAIFGT